MAPLRGFGTQRQPIEIDDSSDEEVLAPPPRAPATQSQRRRANNNANAVNRLRESDEGESSTGYVTNGPYGGMDFDDIVNQIGREGRERRASQEQRQDSATGSNRGARNSQSSQSAGNDKGKGKAAPSSSNTKRNRAAPAPVDTASGREPPSSPGLPSSPELPPSKRHRRNGSVRDEERDAFPSQAGPSQAHPFQAGPSRSTRSPAASAFKDSAWSKAEPIKTQPHRPGTPKAKGKEKEKEPSQPRGTWGNFEPITAQPHVPASQLAKATAKPQAVSAPAPAPARAATQRERRTEPSTSNRAGPSQASSSRPSSTEPVDSSSNTEPLFLPSSPEPRPSRTFARKTSRRPPPPDASRVPRAGPSTNTVTNTRATHTTPQPPSQPPSAPASSQRPRWATAPSGNAPSPPRVPVTLPKQIAEELPNEPIDNGPGLGLGDDLELGDDPFGDSTTLPPVRASARSSATPTAVSRVGTPKEPTPKATTPKESTPKAPTPKGATSEEATPQARAPKAPSPNLAAAQAASSKAASKAASRTPPTTASRANGTVHVESSKEQLQSGQPANNQNVDIEIEVLRANQVETLQLPDEEDELQSSPTTAHRGINVNGPAGTANSAATRRGKSNDESDDDVLVLDSIDVDIDMTPPAEAGPSGLQSSLLPRSPSQPLQPPIIVDAEAWESRPRPGLNPMDELQWILCGKKSIDEPVDPTDTAPSSSLVLTGAEIPPPDRKGKARRYPEEECRQFLWKWNEIAPLLSKNPRLHCSMFEAFASMSTSEDVMDEPAAPELTVDPKGDAAPPFEFFYSNDMLYHKDVPDPELGAGCDCEGPCDPLNDNCLCVRRQNAYFYTTGLKGFNYQDGKLVQGDCATWECGPKCGCPPECSNRVIQRGRGKNVKIELFKTRDRGWGVKTLSPIPKGTFIGIYAGEVLTDLESECRGEIYDKTDRTYLFDMDGYHIGNPPPREELEAIDPRLAELAYVVRARAVAQQSPEELVKMEVKWGAIDRYSAYSVDAFHYGFTRFANHSCNPNVRIAQAYVYDFHPERPLLAMFTTRNVAADEELTISYKGEKTAEEPDFTMIDDDLYIPKKKATPKLTPKRGINAKSTAAHDPGMGRKARCLCGAAICNGSMFSWEDDV